MPNETIGYTPESAIQKPILASLPETRKAEYKDETEIKLVNLNNIDRKISGMPDELLDVIATKMATKGISATNIKTTL